MLHILNAAHLRTFVRLSDMKFSVSSSKSKLPILKSFWISFFVCQFLEPHHMHIKRIDSRSLHFTLLRIRVQRIILHFITGIKNTFRRLRFILWRNKERKKSLKRVKVAVSGAYDRERRKKCMQISDDSISKQIFTFGRRDKKGPFSLQQGSSNDMVI